MKSRRFTRYLAVALVLLAAAAVPRAQQPAASDTTEYGPPKGKLVIVGGGNLNGSGINEKFIELAQEVKELTRYAAEHDLTIAVMGCRVNGPGETDDADLGLWCGPTHVNLKKGSAELGAYPYAEILARLRQELDALIAAR